jgi:hypothetical protein
MFIGPHTADSQRGADHYAELCGGVPSHVAAQGVAHDVIGGRDPWPAALVFDACDRDEQWATADVLRETCAWTETDGWVLRELVTI